MIWKRLRSCCPIGPTSCQFFSTHALMVSSAASKIGPEQSHDLSTAFANLQNASERSAQFLVGGGKSWSLLFSGKHGNSI